MSNIYFICENCGIETNGITLVNGMKFCAKCYHQIFGKDNQQTEIDQLKQQLAEKQKMVDEINKEFVQAVHDWKTLCAEKDQRITELEKELDEIKEKAIVPKFKIGQRVWYISQNNDNVYEFKIKEMVFTRCKDGREMIVYYEEYCSKMYEYELYSSKEEAEKKLQELRGGECHNN